MLQIFHKMILILWILFQMSYIDENGIDIYTQFIGDIFTNIKFESFFHFIQNHNLG